MNSIARDFRPKELSNRRIKESEIIAVVENFSIRGLKKIALIKSVSAELPAFFISLYKPPSKQLSFKMEFLTDRARLFSCKVFCLLETQYWHDIGQSTTQDTENRAVKTYNHFCEFPLNISFPDYCEFKELFLQNDEFTLKCKVTYFELTFPQNIDAIGNGLASPQSLQKSSQKKKDQQESQSTTLALISLYKEKTLCDTTLRTGSESFPAHKTVLSARSPVFKKMFTSDMKERASDCVDISDINADTLSKLLVFLYTDTIADIEWQSAMELYFASDKYQIDSLKLKCSAYLKSNVQPSNCCDLLLLSDMHQDADLKQFVKDYIIRRDQDIFRSDEWRNFMASHVQLAADAMYFKYETK